MTHSECAYVRFFPGQSIHYSLYFISIDPDWLLQAIGCRTSQNTIHTKTDSKTEPCYMQYNGNTEFIVKNIEL
jgi:hypothetical protein